MWTRQDDAELIRNTVGSRSNGSIAYDYVTRYASDDSGIVVEVKEHLGGAGQDPCWVTIQRTAAEVPRKKPRHE
ncbi:hypothetical protein AAVH_24168 [Aphelenchoides avenae]|nr:hypothetical protein AAVH_24168 [Aphelenchus avenae]